MDFSLTRLVKVRLTEFSFQLTPKWKLSLSPAHGPAHHSLETHFSLNMAAVSYLLFVWQNSDRCISFFINICLHSVFDSVSSTDYSTRYLLWIIFFPAFFFYFLQFVLRVVILPFLCIISNILDWLLFPGHFMIAILLLILFPHSRISGNNHYYNKCKWHYYPQYIPFYIIRLLLLVESFLIRINPHWLLRYSKLPVLGSLLPYIYHSFSLILHWFL